MKWNWVIVAVLGAALVIAIAVSAARDGTWRSGPGPLTPGGPLPSNTASATGGRGSTPLQPDGDICGGQRVSLADAVRTMPFPVYMPHTDLAKRGNLEQVWLCSADQTVLQFPRSVYVTVGASHLADPEQEWRQLDEDYPEFSVGSMHGAPASLADPALGALGGVDWVENGIRFTVTGNGEIPLVDLVSLGDSLTPISTSTSSVGPSPST